MRRGVRGLVIVLGTLWVAASAGAATLLYAGSWDGGAAPFGPRAVLVDGIIEDYAGPVVGLLEAPEVVYGPGAVTPYPNPGLGPPTRTMPMPGAPRFGRRDFVPYPSPSPPISPSFPPPPNRHLFAPPGGPVLYHPIFPPALGPFAGFHGDDWSELLLGLFEDLCPSLLLPQDFAEESWRILRDLVEALPYPDSPGLHLNFLEDGDSTLVAVDGLGLVQIDDARLELGSLEATSAGGDLIDASVVVTAIPEPATGALMLAGLCAFAARRRRC